MNSKSKSKSDGPLSKAWWITLVVGGIATIFAAVAQEFYKDLKSWVFPGEIFGSYVLLSADDVTPQQVNSSALKIKSHGYELWGKESAGEKSWVYAGYINMGYLVLSYRSKDPQGIGVGQYFLEPGDGVRAKFIGKMVGNFCDQKTHPPKRRILQCNVVMVRGELGGPEERDARSSFRQYLSEACKLVDEASNISPATCGAPTK